MAEVTVIVPRDKEYTLFCEGKLIHLETLPTIYRLEMDFDYPIILYYTHRYHRRLYIIMKPCPPLICENVDVRSPFSVIAQLRGRGFDRFKRSMWYIKRKTNGLCYRFPPSFYFKLSYLANNEKNSRFNLNMLINQYLKKTGIVNE